MGEVVVVDYRTISWNVDCLEFSGNICWKPKLWVVEIKV